MIIGVVNRDGVPMIQVVIAGAHWQAIIDTGFNGELELPDGLRPFINPQFVGRVTSLLAVNQRVEEDLYLVDFPFDGQSVRAQATFVPSSDILIGTRLLRDHRLRIDFPSRTLEIER